MIHLLMIKQIFQRRLNIVNHSLQRIRTLQLMIVRGHFIDNNFLKVLVQHIVKQEMMVSSKLDFGYRFLKYISITFRGERNTVIEDIYDYNSFLWLIDPQKFNESVEKSKIENYVVDRNLCELYQMKNDVSQKHINKIFSLIETSIHNEIEIEFQLNEIQFEQQTQQYSLNNYGEKQPNLKKNLLPEVVKEVTQSHIEANNLIAIKKSLKKSQIKKVASLNVFISHSSIPKNVVLSKLLDICRVYYQPRLLDYILSRFIPYIHSLHHNYFDSTLFYILGEILNYVVSQINNFGGFYLPKYVNDTNIFSIRQNYFYDLIPYEMKEFSMNYFEIFSQIKHSSHYQYWISLLTNHVGVYETATSSKVKNYNKLKSELSQFQSPKQKDMLQINKSYYNQMHQDGEFYKITEKSTWFKKIEAGIGYKNSNIFALSYYQDPKKGEKSIKHGLIRKILCKTYSEEIDKLKSIYFTEFQHIKNPFSSTSQISDKQMQKMLNELQNFSPTLSYYLVHTFSHNLKNPNKFYDQIGEKIADISAYKNFLNCPQFLDLYMNYYKDNELMLREILYWKAPDIQLLMKYINNDYQDQQFLQLYFTKAMKLLFAQQLIFYLPQIFLSLGTNAGPIIQHFLLDYALDADMFAHQLMWMARVESYQVQEDIEKNQQLEKIAILARAIRKKLWRNMTQDSKNYFKKLDTFFESLTEISTTIKPKDPKDHKNEVIQKNLKQIQDNLPTNCYLPTNNEWEVVSIIPESGRALQSAAKCPFMVTFNCKKYYRQKENQQIDVVKKNSCDNLDDTFNECHDKSFIKYLQNPIKINKFPDQKQIDNKRNKLNNSSIDKKNNVSSNNATNSSQGEEIFSNDLGKQEQKMKAASVRSQIKYDTYKSLLKHNVQAVIDLPQDKNKIINQKGKGKQEKNQKIPCIFKVNDDIRQDNLALQIIQLFQYVFQKNQLDLIVFPYKTIATRTGKQDNIGGIIEVVRDSQSRDEIGKKNDYNLYTYFQNKFGNENSIEFQRARENFIKSQAPYSIISYILQIKDRHNGNILIDEHGHLIHIDFGFIFTISPAKNLGFERANFKLTEEMIKIMGGSKNSEAFQFYVNQTIKAFLAARKYHQHMINVIELMTRSSLPCFRKGAMESLAKRFMLDKNDIEASIQMKKIIYNAYDNIFTRIYDSFQQLTNKIHK
ncbi:Protein kinase-like domain [Pseudocohnilembus persalinus]|uniref:1-phosphatidylinositol 4-kinase n=1 Tax=Pseudocohnilembus persalinus TaxID=266149 RepID=A0A0V0QSR7_PSEPJ|nr:Protein kinase-like domain [Pseudocohnilembus persalinus]|eukprot:KRX05034.1 Protein kinase-like domain [Pseudocohnilembus persalinus]